MKIRIICLFSLVYVASAFSQPKDTAWKQLSLREKIGQTMLMRYAGNDPFSEGDGTRSY